MEDHLHKNCTEVRSTIHLIEMQGESQKKLGGKILLAVM